MESAIKRFQPLLLVKQEFVLDEIPHSFNGF